MVYVKRIFHPVGQGAFFTEQFYDATMGTVLYNVVYDCGSKSTGIGTQIERDIRNSFHSRKKIDVLFLSHFDDDHVNYVGYLKKECYLQSTRIFIPMVLDEKRLGIEPYITNYQFVLSLNEQGEDGTKVIQVKYDESDGEISAPVITNEPLIIENINDREIKSGITLRPKDDTIGEIWRYTLMNVQFKELIAEFKKKLGESDPKLDYDQLNDVNYVERNIVPLRKVYQNLGKKPKDGTAINLNSLLVMSYPVESCNCIYIGCMHMNKRYPRFVCRWGYKGSCLYTGDTSANEMLVWNKIEQMIVKCLGQNKKLMMLQVPHHGSIYSYDKKMLVSDKFSYGFTNCDPYYKQRLFDDDLPMKFATNKKPLILVTREYSSQYEEYWELIQGTQNGL